MAGMILPHVIEVMDRRWKWGEADCCTAACDVFQRLTGIDPMAPLRGRYDSWDSAHALIKEMGGFEAMTDTLAAEAGLVQSDGRPGDIGVVFGQANGFALGICLKPGAWAGKSISGFRTLPGFLRCWHA